MCVSKEVSLGAFIICTLTCFYLYKRNRVNDRWIAVMFGYFGTMQFLEYLMWKDQECTGLNQIATECLVSSRLTLSALHNKLC